MNVHADSKVQYIYKTSLELPSTFAHALNTCRLQTEFGDVVLPLYSLMSNKTQVVLR